MNKLEDLREIKELINIYRKDVNNDNNLIPTKLRNIENYEKIKNYKDSEYSYCIAYEILIRSKHYKSLVYKYEKVMNNHKKTKVTKKESIILLEKCMEQLGLNKNSFYGFGLEEYKSRKLIRESMSVHHNTSISENERQTKMEQIEIVYNIFAQNKRSIFHKNIFELIKLYEEIQNDSSFKYTAVKKLVLKNDESILEKIAEYYFKKDELYEKDVIANFLNSYEENYIICKKSIEPLSLDRYYLKINLKEIPKKDIYIKLTGDNFFVEFLDKDFFNTLEIYDQNIIVYDQYNEISSINFWNKYKLKDLKNGIYNLINHYSLNNKLYNNKKQKTRFMYGLSDTEYYIKMTNNKTRKSTNKFIRISDKIPLSFLDDNFLQMLSLSDLKKHIPNAYYKYSIPKLFFREQKLINIPINLNSSKEELISFMIEIKNIYDNEGFNFLKVPYESAITKNIQISKNILNNKQEQQNYYESTHYKSLNKTFASISKEYKETKDLLPTEITKFKQSLAIAFYLYDVLLFLETKTIKNLIQTKKELIKQEYSQKSKNLDTDSLKELKIDLKLDLKKFDSINILTSLIPDYKDEKKISSRMVNFYIELISDLIKQNRFKDLIIYKTNLFTYNKSFLKDIIV